MATPAFCPACGGAQASDARFCANCGQAFDETPAATPVLSADQANARQVLYAQSFGLKMLLGRFVGLVAGVLIWWFAIGPLLAANVIGQLVAIAVLAFGGIFIGQTVVLSLMAGSRR